MKKVFFVILAALIAVMLFFLFKINQDIQNNKTTEENQIVNEEKAEEIPVDKRSVSYNGWLYTKGTKLLNEHDEIIQLRGISSHGIEWYGNLVTKENLKELKEKWNTNIFRIAMYTDTNDGNGFCFHQDTDKELAYQIIDMCIELDMYVIMDWHILSDNNPQIHQDTAITFFDEVSKKYSEVPNVIYEICNEPNGATDWNNNIKPYAEAVIPKIRNNSPKSLIIVGTPNWSQYVNKAADNPLSFNNICYSLHFYSGTHREELREIAQYAIDKGLCLFVSECGMSQASGDGDIAPNEFKNWVSFMDKNSLSYCYWSLSNKNESSSMLLPSYTPKTRVETTADDANNTTQENIVTNNTNVTNTTSSNDSYEQQLKSLINSNVNNSNTTNTANTTTTITNNINDGLTNDESISYKELPQSMDNFISDSGKAIKEILNSYIN